MGRGFSRACAHCGGRREPARGPARCRGLVRAGRIFRLESRLLARPRGKSGGVATHGRAGSAAGRQAGRRFAGEFQEAAHAAARHARRPALQAGARSMPRSGQGGGFHDPRRRGDHRQAHPRTIEGSAHPSAAQLRRPRHRDARGAAPRRQAAARRDHAHGVAGERQPSGNLGQRRRRGHRRRESQGGGRQTRASLHRPPRIPSTNPRPWRWSSRRTCPPAR